MVRLQNEMNASAMANEGKMMTLQRRLEVANGVSKTLRGMRKKAR